MSSVIQSIVCNVVKSRHKSKSLQTKQFGPSRLHYSSWLGFLRDLAMLACRSEQPLTCRQMFGLDSDSSSHSDNGGARVMTVSCESEPASDAPAYTQSSTCSSEPFEDYGPNKLIDKVLQGFRRSPSYGFSSEFSLFQHVSSFLYTAGPNFFFEETNHG